MTSRLDAVVRNARARFEAAGLPDAAFESRLLIGGLLGISATDVFTGGDRVLSEAELSVIDRAVTRRLEREPVHRILGAREFHGLRLSLSAETLEPRDDTEILVETVLPHLRRMAERERPVRLLDLGVGTGAIGLALLKSCPDAVVLGTDISGNALATAARNAQMNDVAGRYETRLSDWFSAITERFHMIVSNPPYIASSVVDELEPEVRDFDPRAALDGGIDGLDAYRAIAAGAASHLETSGLVAVEIGFDQKEQVTALFAARGFSRLQAVADYGGNDRVLVFACNRLQQ